LKGGDYAILKKPEEEKSTDFLACMRHLLDEEFGDKTFLLLLIFTLTWTNWSKYTETKAEKG